MMIRGAKFAFGFFLIIFSGFVIAASADSYYKSAEEYFEQNKYKEAIIELKNTLKRDPDHKDGRILLGKTYLVIGQPAAAERELQKARDLGADPQKYLFILGDTYILLGKYQQIIDELSLGEKSTSEQKSDYAVLRAYAFRGLNNYKDAEKEFVKAKNLNSKNIKAIIGLSGMEVVRGDLVKAEDLLLEAEKIDSKNIEVHINKAALYMRQEDIKKAIASLEDASKIDPENGRVLIGMAQVYLVSGEIEKCKKNVDKLLKKNAKHPIVNYLKATLLFLDKKYDESETYVQKVLLAAPDHQKTHKLYGAIGLAKKKFYLAEEHLQKAVQLDPMDKKAVLGLVEARFAIKDVDGAQEVLVNAMEKWPEDHQILSTLGNLYLKTGNKVEGSKLLEKAAKISPDSASIRTSLALSKLVSGDTKGAMSDLEAAVSLDQGFLQADALLVMTLLNDGQKDKAKTMADDLVKKHGDNPLVYNLRGELNLKLQDEKNAIPDFKKAIEIDPKFIKSRMALSGIYVKNNDIEKAEAQFKTILKINPNYIEAMLGMALVSDIKKDQGKKLTWILKAYETAPDSIKTAIILTKEYMRRGENAKAMEVSREIFKKYPDNEAIIAIYAETLALNKEYLRAYEHYNKLTDINPDRKLAYYMSAKMQLLLGNDEKAYKSIEKGLKQSPSNLFLIEKKIELLNKMGKLDEAEKVAIEVKNSDPKGYAGSILHGNVYIAKKEYKKAIFEYNKALDIKESADLRVRLFNLYKRTGEVEKGVAQLKQWYKNNPESENVSALTLLAMIYQEKQDNDIAIKLYEKILTLQEKNILAINNLAWLYFDHGKDKEKAKQLAKKGYEINPQVSAVVDTYGWILVNSGDLKQGLKMLKKAYSQSSNANDIGYHYAFALNKSGDKAKAVSILEKSLADGKKFLGREDAEALLKEIK